MGFFKRPEGLAYLYFSLLLISLKCHVLGQSCMSQQIETKPEAAATVTDCENDQKSSQSSIPTPAISGLEFIRDGLQLNLDKKLFLGNETADFENRRNFSPIELVQMFIRNLKGLPTKSEHSQATIGSGTSFDEKKPDWCFHPYELRELVKVELRIFRILQVFQEKEADALALNPFPALESYLVDIDESSLQALRIVVDSNEKLGKHEDPYLYVASHPLLVYRLIRRFVEDLQPILARLETYSNGDDLIGALYKKANPDLLVFPTTSDLEDALESIRRMQVGNGLNTYELGRGILENVDTGIQLNALYSLELGAFYLSEEDHDLAIQWVYFALETVRKSPVVKVYPEIEEFFDYVLFSAIEKHNQNFGGKYQYKWDPAVFNTTVEYTFDPSAYLRRSDELKPMALLDRNKTKWNWALMANFRRTCAGEMLQSDAERALLKCWNDKSRNLYWLIQPLKMELLNMDPPVYQIYDFMGEKFMEDLKSAAIPDLERSTVVDRKSATLSKDDTIRTSSHTWLYDNRESGKFIRPFTKQLELLTGLNISPPSASDAYQVAAYGPSHHYDAHIDSFDDPRKAVSKGNRITTIMGYLSDVKVGGRTGFPVFGIFTEPIKGSVVMWDNMKRNGEFRDERSWHGGCPVVLGVKLITNKWIYYKENAFTFQCTLNPDE